MPPYTTVITFFAIAQGDMHVAVAVIAWMIVIGRVPVIASAGVVMTTSTMMVVAAIW